MSNIIITNHALKRGKQRLNLSKDSFERLAIIAFSKGITHSQSKSNLSKYITKLWFRNKNVNNTKIYGENIFLLSGNVLVTVHQLPNNLKKYLKFLKQQ